MQQEIYNKLNKMTKDAANNASFALSKLSGELIKVEAKRVDIENVRKNFLKIKPESMVVGIYLPIIGDLTGATLLIFPEDVACKIVGFLLEKKIQTGRKFSELERSTLKEVGNIIGGSFLTVFANTLRIKLIEQAPSLSFDMFGAVIDQVIADFAQHSNEGLLIELEFNFVETQVIGQIVLAFGLEDMNKIFNNLKING